MAKRKMIQSNLIKNSICAYFGAIEIHNKPKISYRYETVTLLMMNAWELLLKAFIKKYVKNKSIFEDKEEHTISFCKAINYTEEYINSIKPKSFMSIKENLILIEDYRNNIVHFYNEQLEPYIFMLTAKAALNYVEFINTYFDKDIMDNEGLFILPLGFKLPFKPEDFLTHKAAKYISSKESKEFITKMVNVISDLGDKGVEDTIVVGFDIYLENIKKMTNSDLKVAITNLDNADATFTKVQKVQIVNDSNAQKMQLSDDELFARYPLTYKEVSKCCKNRLKDFKQDKKFNEIIKHVKDGSQYCYNRKLNPKSKTIVATTFYSQLAVEEIIKEYGVNSEI
ncbi:DUF3644 domain-containing protein [[Clostridium] fimetarium]|uniref:DUF3644 domain-containing protein n=1 Tax=[Clostridium] fimetarium TaxID=99656 RepID=A0A1I0MXJ6_9FIRM|nr:DUF3644 domain-containing protein [[Clostridium] fimetarium]SEV93490.1 hypothetical protein SAMN05421659_102230 [[Clostridium] fimetarium]